MTTFYKAIFSQVCFDLGILDLDFVSHVKCYTDTPRYLPALRLSPESHRGPEFPPPVPVPVQAGSLQSTCSVALAPPSGVNDILRRRRSLGGRACDMFH